MDGLQIIREAGTSAERQPFEPPVLADDLSDVLAELAHSVEYDLATPDHAPATERTYAHDWADFVTFGKRHGIETLPAAPQTLALSSKRFRPA